MRWNYLISIVLLAYYSSSYYILHFKLYGTWADHLLHYFILKIDVTTYVVFDYNNGNYDFLFEYMVEFFLQYPLIMMLEVLGK